MAHMILGLETYLGEQAKADYFMLIESIKNICPVKADTVFINAIKDNHIELGIISHNTEVATLDLQVNETSLSVNSTVHVRDQAADCASFIMVSLVNNW